jgi:hypothetical protein
MMIPQTIYQLSSQPGLWPHFKSAAWDVTFEQVLEIIDLWVLFSTLLFYGDSVNNNGSFLLADSDIPLAGPHLASHGRRRRRAARRAGERRRRFQW